NARNATVSAVSSAMRISVIGRAIPASDLIDASSKRDPLRIALSSYTQAHRLAIGPRVLHVPACPAREPSGAEVAKTMPDGRGRISGREHIVLRYKWCGPDRAIEHFRSSDPGRLASVERELSRPRDTA